MIAVIIPAHNEESTIGAVIDGVEDVLQAEQYRIIVTCDRCSDNTESIARSRDADVVISRDAGLAGSYRTGISRALRYDPEIVVHIDADNQYDAKDIGVLLALVRNGCDLAMGDRIRTKPDGLSWTKFLLNHAGSLVYSVLLRHYIADMTDGLRVFNKQVAWLPIMSRYTFTQEQVWRTIKAGYKIRFARIAFRKRLNGDSRLMKHPMEYITRSAKDFWRFAR